MKFLRKQQGVLRIKSMIGLLVCFGAVLSGGYCLLSENNLVLGGTYVYITGLEPGAGQTREKTASFFVPEDDQLIELQLYLEGEILEGQISIYDSSCNILYFGDLAEAGCEEGVLSGGLFSERGRYFIKLTAAAGTNTAKCSIYGKIFDYKNRIPPR